MNDNLETIINKFEWFRQLGNVVDDDSAEEFMARYDALIHDVEDQGSYTCNHNLAKDRYTIFYTGIDSRMELVSSFTTENPDLRRYLVKRLLDCI